MKNIIPIVTIGMHMYIYVTLYSNGFFEKIMDFRYYSFKISLYSTTFLSDNLTFN